MFSYQTPSEILDILISKIDEIGMSHKIHNKKWQLTFEKLGKYDSEEKSQDALSEYCNVQVKILRIPKSDN